MKTVHSEEELRCVEDALGRTFDDKSLLSRALTHSSFANEQPVPTLDNERLEFLGDAFIQIVLARHLWAAEEGHDPGDLTFWRVASSHGEYQQDLARALGLGPYLRLGGGPNEPTNRMLEDAFEAIVGAMVADAGGDASREAEVADWVLALMQRHTPKAWAGLYVSTLNEWFQRQHRTGIPWGVAESTGPQQDPTWTVELGLPDGSSFVGTGSKKGIAKADAARQALESMGLLEG